MIKNRVSVRRHISSNKSQKRVTLASSSGASTSSSTQIGAGLAKNTAKISAIAVSVCSPPDNKDKVLSFFPGGWHIISSPASSGSSLSTKTKFASPPPNKCLNNSPKLLFTCSNAVKSRSRPSRFKPAMPLRSVCIAASKSVFSSLKLLCSLSTSLASSSARRFTAPNASRWRFNRFTSASISSACGMRSASVDKEFSKSCGVVCNSSSMRCAAAVLVSCAASARASAPARASRASEAARSESRSCAMALRKAASPVAKLSPAALRRVSACAMALLNSSRLRAKASGTSAASAKSASVWDLRSSNSTRL